MRRPKPASPVLPVLTGLVGVLLSLSTKSIGCSLHCAIGTIPPCGQHIADPSDRFWGWVKTNWRKNNMYELKQKGSQPALRVFAPSAPRPDESLGPAQQELGAPLNIRQVARVIGCSVWTVRQTLIPRGLPHFRFTPLGRLVFLRRSSRPMDPETATSIKRST